jgi:hypothetical protein
VHGAANVSSVNNKQRGTINTHLQGTTTKKAKPFFFQEHMAYYFAKAT